MEVVPAAVRKVTSQITVGDVPVGGDSPITVQSMTITKTADVEGTLQQIYALAGAGADIVRCTCNEYRRGRGSRSGSSCPARPCRSSLTYTTSTRWR